MVNTCKRHRLPIATATAALGLLVAAPLAGATTFVPNRFDDTMLPIGTQCTPASPPHECTLRGALSQAHNGDTIYSPPGRTSSACPRWRSPTT